MSADCGTLLFICKHVAALVSVRAWPSHRSCRHMFCVHVLIVVHKVQYKAYFIVYSY